MNHDFVPTHAGCPTLDKRLYRLAGWGIVCGNKRPLSFPGSGGLGKTLKINVQDEKTVVRYPTSTQRTSSLGTPACRTMRLFVEGGASGIEWKNVPDNAARARFLRIGLVLIWFVYKRRKSGLILAGLATVVCFALWKMFVP